MIAVLSNDDQNGPRDEKVIAGAWDMGQAGALRDW